MPFRARAARAIHQLAATLAVVLLGGVIVLPSLATALPGGAAVPNSKTPTFPVPATARPQPSTGGTAVAPDATGAPTTTTTPATPTTTPSVVTPAPSATTTTTAPSTLGAATPTKPPSTTAVHRTSKQKLSTPAIALAALGALVVLVCLLWGLARVLAFEPRWMLSLRHSLAEGGFRASATWAEFGDWARLGK